MKYLFLLFLLLNLVQSKYLDNHSCKECHEKIYNEFESSAHAKSFFTDELHRKIALKVDSKKYGCAFCHMPGANNLKDLVDGKARPDIKNVTHTDGVSCYFCHTIAYVKKAHKFNINTKARQAKNYKPSFFGDLKNPDDSDKHSSLHNPIYNKIVCMGCHSHKLNDYNVTVFKAMDKKQDSKECIKCHMPLIEGGVEKMDKRARGHHKSHKFLGIRDVKFRATGVDINITLDKNGFDVILKNKMAHPLIIQPARAKYLEIKILRDGKTIWQNYKKSPKEDAKAYFAYSFKKDGKPIIIPDQATSFSVNNLEAKKTKVFKYHTPKLKKGDIIEVNFWVQLAKDDCKKVINLEDKSYLKPMLIKSIYKKVD
jgi:hypothetical protein